MTRRMVELGFATRFAPLALGAVLAGVPAVFAMSGGLIAGVSGDLTLAAALAAKPPAGSAASSTLAPLSPAHLQVLLARANFSPGLIDGNAGRKTRLAMQQFQDARGLEQTASLDAATQAALRKAAGREGTAGETWTKPYRITEADLALITGPVPTDWIERSLLELCGYATLSELLAERGWCSEGLVASLNPGVDLANLIAGDEVELPDVPDWRGSAAKASRDAVMTTKVSRLEVDLAERFVKGFDDAGTQVMLMHCSIAKSAEKRPVGELKVKVIATDPDYTFDPKDWPEVADINRKLRIAPGPRNPVGSAWVGLDKPGYGLHGTVRPQDIGKTGSHGCFRLANWDAARLARMVKIGTPVSIRE